MAASAQPTQPMSAADRCMESMKIIAGDLGLKGQVDKNGNRIKITNQMIIDKIRAMRDEISVLKTECKIHKRKFDPVTVYAPDESDAPDASADPLAKLAKLPPKPTFLPKSKIDPHKLEIIKALPDVPEKYGGLAKFMQFRNRDGIALVVIGFDFSRHAFGLRCAVEADLTNMESAYSSIQPHLMDPEWVCRRYGIDIDDMVSSVLITKFWSVFGGLPRELEACIHNRWVRVGVVRWNLRARKFPILVKIMQGRLTGKIFEMPKRFDLFREVSA